MRLGRPAFGWIRQRQATGLGVHLLQHLVERTRSRPSSSPRAPGPASARRRSRDLGGRTARERGAVVGERHLRDDRHVGDRADRRDGERDLVQVRERLDDERVDAALEERLGLLAERRRAPRRAVTVPSGARYLPSGPIEPSTKTSGPALSRTSRASATPRRLISRTCSSRPWAASLNRLAPNVLVSMQSAPAAT